ncbi:BRCA1-associated RING domain protein 1-like [Pecten maximus]|uniref:BRCA1-associated RING domain protein 1-like n=1 Tax=Pecten maximus TaxID=6579 RepID=UPI0014588EF3|nr:BRCA1-associated RING domain protein 1-like [Pecten maximus]
MAVQYEHTRSALSRLQTLLNCSKCNRIASSPCTLGSCEHIYCRECCEDVLGKSCPVCHIPTDVRDAQVNRQLFTLVSLSKRLEEILASSPKDSGHSYVSDDQTTHLAPETTSDHKSSPTAMGVKPNVTKQPCRRSTPAKPGKIPGSKCSVLSSPASKLGTRDTVPVNQSTMTQHFGYTDNDEMTGEDEAIPETLVHRKVCDEVPVCNISGDSCMPQDSSRSSRSRTQSPRLSTVSRQKSPVTVETPKDKTTATSTRNAKTQRRRSLPVKNTRNLRVRVLEKSDKDANQTEMKENKPNKKAVNKRHSIGAVTAETISASLAVSGKKKSRRSLSPALVTGRYNISSSPATRSGGSTRSKVNSTGMNTSLTGSGKKVVNEMEKRNAKGETPLQVGCIKGDLVKVKELLEGGATPNTRDNAGWTPLHEACHYGYVDIARLLLDYGALIDVPGTENATPLHDAVSHGRVQCVALLVSRGASLATRNLYGYTPVDCARSEEIKTALKTPVQSAPIVKETVDVLEYQLPCLLGTALNREQKIALQRCAALLNAKVVQDFSPEVTHVITSNNQDGQCPRTIKYLMAVLQGKWVINMDWVNTCLEYGSRVSEEAFEIPGTSANPNTLAPQRGRTNKKLQLPGLFDGCQFYFHGKFVYPTPDKTELMDLVKAGGGLILRREPKVDSLDESTLTVPYHADPESDCAQCCVFVLHDNSVTFPKINTRRMCSLPVRWLMDCMSTFTLINHCNKY